MRKLFLPSKHLSSPLDKSADFVELFFDLVFVFAITRITALTAHHLDPVHVLQSVLIFWLVWWAWTQFTWALNTANTKIAEVRLMVLVATAVVFVMASSADLAFGEGVLWFAVPYVLVRLIGLSLYLRIASHSKKHRAMVLNFALLSLTGLIAVLAGAMVNPSLRIILWLSAIFFDMLASHVTVNTKADGLSIMVKHFAERHGLIVIIALGESLIVAASSIIGQERSWDLIFVVGAAVIITCLLWWSYFSWINEHLEEQLAEKSGIEQSSISRDAYSIMHFLILCGIVGVAVGFEKILLHPHDVLKTSVAMALGGGYALFVGFSAAAVWRTSKLILFPRLLIILVSTIGIYLSIGHPPLYALSITAVSLFLITFLEWKKCSRN
jgi:low temperature requirement protein LtrA